MDLSTLTQVIAARQRSDLDALDRGAVDRVQPHW